MRYLALVVLAVAPAAADPPSIKAPADVNLATAVPLTIAVSSTVANASILPEHLVDGKLDTAWNSRTGDLVGAWIALRVPGDAHVTRIRMTAGFTVKDKRGDLFTMNPRIRKLMLWRGTSRMREITLDPERRDLQDIPVDLDGGDFKLVVSELVPGTKATWREVCVSELEVWGTLPAGTHGHPSRPIVRVGGLDAPAFAADRCVPLMFPGARGGKIAPDGDVVRATSAIALEPHLVVCQVEHAADATTGDRTVEIALVRPSPPSVLDRQSFPVSRTTASDVDVVTESAIELSTLRLTVDEDALIVAEVETASGPMTADSSSKSTVYRATRTGLVPILTFASKDDNGESRNADLCTLAIGTRRAPLPDLDLVCDHVEGRWHDEDPRGNGEYHDEKTTHYRWDGKAYQPR